MDVKNWKRKRVSMPNMKALSMKVLGVLLVFAIVLPLSTAVAAADVYPSKPVRLIIPFSPGGSNDIIGRLIAAKLSERFGEQVVVGNHPGAGGLLGTQMAAKATPDGYTLLIVSTAYAVSPSLYKLQYDPVKSFAPVVKLGIVPIVLCVNPRVPANSVQELIALAKKQPGKLIYASGGIGSFGHLATELFNSMAGINIMGVQFKGAGPSIIDVMGGHSQMVLGGVMAVMSHIQSGKLKALGVGGKKRSSVLPDVPTIDEAGVPGYEATNWWGIVVPAGTPAPIVDKLNKELTVILSLDEIKKKFESYGAEVDYMGPTEFGPFVTEEINKWSRIIKEANIKKKE